VQAKHEPLVLERWPPPATVHEVLVDDTPLCAVVVNRRNREPESVLEATRAWAERRGTHAHLYALGTTAYLVGRHEEAVEAFSRAAEMEPEDAPTWFALGAAQGMLGRWDDQIAATLRALRIDPRFAGARVNLEYALRRRNETNPRRSEAHRSRDEYVEASLARFAEERYEESAEACRLALARDPTSAVAYNNLCAAYNAMRQYEEAREACEIAVGLDPDLPRARNNLAVARAGSR
jgi:tetratricopeptide (TPR) repeat protein